MIRRPQSAHRGKTSLIIGAGAAGMMVAPLVAVKSGHGLHPVAFTGDDATKYHLEVLGLPVVGVRDCISDTVANRDIKILLSRSLS